MSDITDCCINADNVYECFICNIKFKHNNQDKFKKHLLTKGHLEKEKKLGLCIEDIKNMTDICERIISFYGISVINKYKLADAVSGYTIAFKFVNQYSKKYEIMIDEFIIKSVSTNKINNDYSNCRVKYFDIKNKETNEIMTINRDKIFIGGLSEYYVLYNDIKDIELKLICDIVYMPHIKYPKKYSYTRVKTGYNIRKRIACKTGLKRMKLKHYLFNSPYWCSDIGYIIDSYI